MRKLYFLLTILWVGCQPATTKQNEPTSYFDMDSFAQRLIENQTNTDKYTVTKISVANGVEEKTRVAKTDSLFSTKELTPLLNANINKPSLSGAYSVTDNLPEKNSNLKRLVYTILPKSNSDVSRLEIKYLDSIEEVRQIVAWITTKNPVYNSKQEVNLWVNRYNGKLLIDSLSIKGFNKTLFQDSLTYQTKLIVKH